MAGLYWAGGGSACLATLAYIVAVVVVFTVPPVPISRGAATLDYIAAHPSVYILEQVLWLAPSVRLMVVFLALYVVLKDVNESYTAIGATLSIPSRALTLAYPATGGRTPAAVCT